MAYQQGSSRKPIHSTRKTVVTQFVRANGAPGPQMQCVETCSVSQDGDIDELRITERHELSCGCYPEKSVAGVCEVCAGEIANPGVCAKHHAVCRGCGASLCMRHSYEGEAKDVRLCKQCHLRAGNAAAIASCTSFLKRMLMAVFYK